MVSINPGSNPYSLSKLNTNKKPVDPNASSICNAPSVPNFPDKNVSTMTTKYCKTFTVTSGCTFTSKSDAYNYVNATVIDQILNDVKMEFNYVSECGKSGTYDVVETSSSSCESSCSTVQYNGGDDENMPIACAISGSTTNVTDINIVDYDIKSIKVIENEDGTYSVSYELSYVVEVTLEIVSDWQPGDTYTDSNGYTWEYREDGSWVDITKNKNNGDTSTKHLFHNDIIDGTYRSTDDLHKELNTNTFLALRDVNIKDLDTLQKFKR